MAIINPLTSNSFSWPSNLAIMYSMWTVGQFYNWAIVIVIDSDNVPNIMSLWFILQNNIEDLRALLNQKGGFDLFVVFINLAILLFVESKMYEMYHSWLSTKYHSQIHISLLQLQTVHQQTCRLGWCLQNHDYSKMKMFLKSRVLSWLSSIVYHYVTL